MSSKYGNIDVTQLPAVKEWKGSMISGVLLVIFGSIFGAIGTMLTFSLISLVFGLICLVLLLIGVSQFFEHGIIRITSDYVTYAKKGLFGTKKWLEPLAQYTGVLKKEELRTSGSRRTRSSHTTYVLELHHAESNKCITLFESRSSSGLRTRWENYARALDIPTIEKENGKIIRREVEDLDKSVRELTKEGKLEISFDPSKQPPKGLKVDIFYDHKKHKEVVMQEFKKQESYA